MLRKTEAARRRMKADYEFVTTPIAVVIFVGVVVALMGFFVHNHMVGVTAEMKVVESQISAVDAAHIVKGCFYGGGGSVSLGFLKDNRGEGICDMCECSGEIGAKVELLEGGLAEGGPKKGDAYDFDFSEKGYTHKIFITVSDQGLNYVSKLTVSIND